MKIHKLGILKKLFTTFSSHLDDPIPIANSITKDLGERKPSPQT